jgi:hypothetical protein
MKIALLLLVAFGIVFIAGWLCSGWICMQQDGCPRWQKKSMKKWSEEMRDQYPDEQYEHHPTAEVDSKDSKGIPSTLGLAADTDARKES